jgi:peroxiredoxin
MQKKRLQSKEMAPAFLTRDWTGQPVTLKGGEGQGITLLCFFRYASCPLCNLRVRELILAHEELTAKGVRILAVFQSPAERIAQYVGQQVPPFPLIPDPELRLYRLYRVETSWAGFARAWTLGLPRVVNAVIAKGFLPGTMENEIHRIPADFLIAADGRLMAVYYGKDIGDHMPLKRIFANIESNILKR